MSEADGKWQNSDAGPRQVKDLKKAIGALQWEGKTFTEVTGVQGGEEHRATMTSPFSPCRAEVTALDEAIRAKYGYQVTKATVRAIIADYEAALPEARESRPVDDKRRTPEEDAEITAAVTAQDAEYAAKRDAANAVRDAVMAKAPHGAKALIIAELKEDRSDTMTDYFANTTVRTIAIGWRFSAREDFKALHAAAAAFPETASVTFTEHRDNHSMGAGNYLSDHGWDGAGSGWVIKSRDLPCKWVDLTEDAIPDAEQWAADYDQRCQATARERDRAGNGTADSPRLPKPARATAISDDVLTILRDATADGNTIRMNSGRLDRAAYVAVNEVLAAAGGKWNRKAQGHVFGEDAAGVLAELTGTGSYTRPQDEGWFPTPAPVVTDMLALADLAPGMSVLEPSAGDGAIASAVAEAGCTVDCVELNAKRAGVIYAAGYARSVTLADFLVLPIRPAYDRVIMNPPFADKADVAHVTHALRFLKPGGVLIAVMSNGVMFREDKTTTAFREMFTRSGGFFEPLPDDAFKASGTGIRTVLAVITL